MTVKTVAIGVALVALAGSALAEERVLYCAETASNGFVWKEGQTEGQATHFNVNRYVVKVLSETERTVTQTTGDIAGKERWLTCRKKREFLVCDDGTGTSTFPYLFQGNKFVRANMFGPQFGGDPNIFISYGTCTGF